MDSRTSEDILSSTIMPFPVSIRAGTGSEDLMKVARARALDPNVFEDNPPSFFDLEISSSRLDSYSTRMMKSSLKNYAADATTGVGVLNSHNHRELPFGQSLTGEYHDGRGVGVQTVTSTFFTVPGMRIGGTSTDDLILSMKAGIARDASIGFYGGRMICNICGEDMFTWDCWHIPGVGYEMPCPPSLGGMPADKKPMKDMATETVLCEGQAEDAHLAEYSVVYDGSTPGAGLLKARAMASTGRIRPEVTRMLEQRWRTHLPEQEFVIPGIARRGANMAEQNTDPGKDATALVASIIPVIALELLTPNVRAALAAAGMDPVEIKVGDDAITSITKIGEEAARLRSENTRLAAQAEDGKLYRNDLVASALEEGVRAQGDSFRAEEYKTILEALPLTAIKRMRDDWQEAARKIFAGGRATHDGRADDDTKKGSGKSVTPLSAYRAS